jgi:hypothetical protein
MEFVFCEVDVCSAFFFNTCCSCGNHGTRFIATVNFEVLLVGLGVLLWYGFLIIEDFLPVNLISLRSGTLVCGSIQYRSSHSLVSTPCVCRMISITKWAGTSAVCSSGISIEFDFSFKLFDFQFKFVIPFLGAVFNLVYSHM